MYYDFQTKNKSFLRLYDYLKSIGIKNNKFFLGIHNEKLIGVDPYDPNLSDQQKEDIINECINNYWYFIREVVRIPIGKDSAIPYRLTNANLAFNFCVDIDINIFFEILRKEGKTVAVITRLLWESIRYDNNSYMFNDNFDNNVLNLHKLKLYKELLPSYLQNRCKDSQIEALKSPTNEIDADTICDSIRGSRVYLDNFSFMKHNDKIYYNSLEKIKDYVDMNIDKYIPSGIIITTVTGDLSYKEVEFSHDCESKCVKFDEIYYDMDIEDIKSYIKTNSSSNFVLIKYNYKELGILESSFNNMCKELNNDQSHIKTELLLEWIK